METVRFEFDDSGNLVNPPELETPEEDGPDMDTDGLPKDLSQHSDKNIRSNFAAALVGFAKERGASEAVVILNWPDNIGAGGAIGDKVRFITMVMGMIYNIFGPQGMDAIVDMHHAVKAVSLKNPDARDAVQQVMGKLITILDPDGNLSSDEQKAMVERAVGKAFMKIANDLPADDFDKIDEIDLDNLTGH